MITFAVTTVLLIAVLAVGYICYVCSQADLIVIKSPGREFTIDCSRWFKRGDSLENLSSEQKRDK